MTMKHCIFLGDNCQSISDLVRAGVEDNQIITIGPILSSVIDLHSLSNLQKWFCERHEHRTTLAEIVTGQEFELFCQKRLQELGLDVKTTPVTGDFGADLVAECAGSTIIIQCKYYSKPIGVAAVQEAFSARAFYNADKAAVVSNQSYTKAARQLAQKNSVMLLHVDELEQLA